MQFMTAVRERFVRRDAVTRLIELVERGFVVDQANGRRGFARKPGQELRLRFEDRRHAV